MDTVVRFPVERLAKHTASKRNRRKSGKSAEILFFSGVRYSPLTTQEGRSAKRKLKAKVSQKLS